MKSLLNMVIVLVEAIESFYPYILLLNRYYPLIYLSKDRMNKILSKLVNISILKNWYSLILIKIGTDYVTG